MTVHHKPVSFADPFGTYIDDVLIVDDEVASLRLLTEVLSQDGYRVRPAESARLAIDSALAKPPGLILLDVKMPDMNGFEVCERLKRHERTRDVPIIFISALHEADDRVRGFEVGGIDFISKPITESEVVARVRVHMNLRNMQLHLGDLVAERTAELEREVATRKQAQSALQESEEKYRSLVENASEAIVVIKDQGLAFWNVRAMEITGYSAGELGSMPYMDLIHPDDRAMVGCEHDRVISGQADVSRYTMRFLARDGRRGWASVNSARIGWQGRPASLVLFSDITELRRSEREAQQQREALARATRWTTLGELAASIAHDINQPLAAISANASTGLSLSRGDDVNVGEIYEILQDIASDSKRAADVIRGLRELLSGKESSRESFDLNALARETIMMLNSELSMRQIALEALWHSEPIIVSAGRVQLQQVMLNLVLNAVEAMESGGAENRPIEVCTDCDEIGIARFTVRDRGTGIREEHMEKVFDQLFSTKPGGLGMGLAISRTIIEAHGGRLSAENNEDLGAKVAFTLPGATVSGVRAASQRS
jgi:PAS domain S-box-containing protein